MKLLSKLLFGAALSATVSTASAEAVEFLKAEHDARITIKKEIVNGVATYSAISHTPDLMEIVDGTLNCGNGQCIFDFNLKTDYAAVPFNQYLPITSTTPYGYVRYTDPVPSIDLVLNAGPHVHIGDVMTEAYTDLNAPLDYVPIERGNSVASVRPNITAADVNKTITARFGLLDIPGEDVVYQSFQIVASGTPQGLKLVENNNLVTPGYEETSTNKGQFIGTWPGVTGYQWYLYGWNTGSGHYAEWRFLTNGTSKHDQGLDLSGYSTIEFAISCYDNITIEAFFGTGEDSSQNYLTDINCGPTEQTFSFDISNANASDIQTALWLHIPTWKNGHAGQYQTISMNVPYLTIER